MQVCYVFIKLFPEEGLYTILKNQGDMVDATIYF